MVFHINDGRRLWAISNHRKTSAKIFKATGAINQALIVIIRKLKLMNISARRRRDPTPVGNISSNKNAVLVFTVGEYF